MRRIDRYRLSAWRWVRWGRRLLAIGLLAAAALLAGGQPGGGRAADEPGVDVLIAQRDLAAGTLVAAGDIAVRAWPQRLVPTGTLTPADEPVGRLLVGAVRAGEPLTDVRLLGPGLSAALEPGLRAVPIRLADAGVAALLRAGDRIDLYAIGTGVDDPPSSLLARHVLVLAVPAQQDSVVPEGGIIVVAAPEATAVRVVQAAYAQAVAATLAPP